MARNVKEMKNMVAKYEKGKLVITVPVEKIIEEDKAVPSSSGKSYLLATTHGNQPCLQMAGVTFSLNVTMKKDAYENVQAARKHLEQLENPTNSDLAKKLASLPPEKLAKLEQLLAML